MSVLRTHVDRLFADAAPQRGLLCLNPVIGGRWLVGADPITVQKKKAYRALLAREWFAVYGPPDAPPLPLSGSEQEDLRYHDPFGHLIAEYARSLEANDWDFQQHPSFDDFACGVLASKHSPDFTRNNAALCERFPPCPLPGIGPGQLWQEPTVTSRGRS